MAIKISSQRGQKRKWMARGISAAFHPVVIQMVLLLLLADQLSFRQLGWIVGLGFVIPAGLTLWYVLGHLKPERGFDGLARPQRNLPLVLNAICLIALLGIEQLDKVQFKPDLLPGFLLASTLTSLAVNQFSRLSLHVAGVMGYAMLHILIPGTFQSDSFTAWLMLAAIVGWARFYLDAHTLPELITGAITGTLTALGYGLIVWQVLDIH